MSACATAPALALEARLQPPESTSPRDLDRALAERARAGDREAFGRLFERHARFVHGLLLARAPSREVPDLVQEAFAAALGAIGSLGDAARFAPWLGAIARNLARDAGRRARAGEPLEDDAVDPRAAGCTPADAAASAELIAIVRELPEAYRETLVLRLVEGLSGPEIAARTGLTHGSVRVNLHRGMRLLRERLGDARGESA
jgi:RNA polymerase sigma-70 factor (ECF subfamily)